MAADGVPVEKAAEARPSISIGPPREFDEECNRQIKTRTVLCPKFAEGAETEAMLFCALLASGQISMRKIAGWQAEKPRDQPIDLAA
jgi:hypothetical protein